MEHIGKMLPKRVKSRRVSPNPSDKPEPVCSLCNGAGVVCPRKQDGSIDYSRVVTCRCKIEELAKEKAVLFQRNCQLPVATEGMTFESFKVDDVTREAYTEAKKLANEDGVKWLTLAGAVDLGKTHLAVAICREWLKRGKPARYAYVPLLLSELREGYGQEGEQSFQKKMDFFLNVPLLVLDDLGVEKPTEFTKEKLNIIIDYRSINALPLVVTTNKPINEIPGDDDHRIASRLRRFDFCRVVAIEGDEWWSRKNGKSGR